VETSVISYRVADFLKRHAPFHAIDDEDLLALAGGGRVRFHEPNEYILWQGEPHRYQVFVIQQGTVSLWDEAGGEARLRDVRGAGDMLGIERYNDAPACLYSARSESDVVIYAFPASDFDAFVLKYPHAMQYVAAESRVTPDYQPAGERRDLPRVFLHDLVGRHALPTCSAGDTIADAAKHLLISRRDAMILVDAEHRARGVLTADAVLGWVAAGAGDPQQPVSTLVQHVPVTVAPDASVADGLLTMGSADVDAVAITHDGTPSGRVHALVTRRDLAPLFGENPASLLRETRVAASTAQLRDLNQRARMFALEHLTGAASVEWLARFTHLVDVAILTRVVSIAAADALPASWCVSSSAGRLESLTMLAPPIVTIADDDVPDDDIREAHARVLSAVLECGYLPRDLPFDPSFYAATARVWKERYRNWVKDPVRQETYRVRSLFDLRAVCGRYPLWHGVTDTIRASIDRDFVHLLANDCLASLPPLTFFQDAVIDSFGEHTTTFKLEESALRPLVDVGRVFALAAREVVGRSTIERFAIARSLVPERDAIFREAADTFRIVLWQQGRVGIAQGTRGAELPAALLSRHDRQVLKGGFRSILQLLEFTAGLEWLEKL
jgi:signal-transduction protein with cAMP-binding, CBS, and nucleotidyltransferase domain